MLIVQPKGKWPWRLRTNTVQCIRIPVGVQLTHPDRNTQNERKATQSNGVPSTVDSVPFIGVPRAVIRDRHAGRREARAVPAQGPMQADFFRHQADIWQAAQLEA